MCDICSTKVVTKDDGAKTEKAVGSFMEVLGYCRVPELHTPRRLSCKKTKAHICLSLCNKGFCTHKGILS